MPGAVSPAEWQLGDHRCCGCRFARLGWFGHAVGGQFAWVTRLRDCCQLHHFGLAPASLLESLPAGREGFEAAVRLVGWGLLA